MVTETEFLVLGLEVQYFEVVKSNSFVLVKYIVVHDSALTLVSVGVPRISEGSKGWVSISTGVFFIKFLEGVSHGAGEGLVSVLSVTRIHIEVSGQNEWVGVKAGDEVGEVVCLTVPVPGVVVQAGQRGQEDVH